MFAKSLLSTLLLAAATLAQAETPPALALRAHATELVGRDLVALEFEAADLPRIAVEPRLLQALMTQGQIVPDTSDDDGRTLKLSRLAAERLIASTIRTRSPEATMIVEADGRVWLK